MRALLAGERLGNVGVVAGLFGVICLLIASFGLNIKQANDLNHIKHVLQERCAARQAVDHRTRDDLTSRIALYTVLMRTETNGVRADAYDVALDGAREALAALPAPVDCARVYASQ